jgi:phosphoribosyl 1,2-cyclic phosphodiesterase
MRLRVVTGRRVALLLPRPCEKPIRYHLDYRTLVAHRARLACRRLILTHLSEDMLARLPELHGEAAEDGLTIRL